VGEPSIGLVARSGRAGERLRWVVRLPGWLRVGLLADAEAVRRITAFTLYCLFVPLAFLLELVSGGATDHPALVAATTVFLVAQAAATWLIRPMPDAGWLFLIAAIPASFVAYAYASITAGQALSIVLVVPVAWVAVFLSVRMVTASVTLNALALAWPALVESTAGHWLTFAVRGLTLAVIAFALHLLVVALRRAQHQAERRADLDAATGLVSRARMLDILDTVPLDGARSAGVVVLDIDHFKQVNDRHGHAAGDAVIRALAEVLKASSRDVDLPGRFGGEEFVIGLAHTDLPGARRFAERLRERIAAAPVAVDPKDGGAAPIAYTVSIGVTVLRENDPGIEDALRRADAAMYRAKEGGRNRVEVLDTGAPALPPPASPASPTSGNV
jgi:diguanylate cyclase (GGDEF)-like protein